MLDLRISESAPDRDAATRAWAAHELGEGRRRARERSARIDEKFAEMARASEEKRTLLRLEAVKRGEVYVPPAPPPAPVPRPAYSPGYGYGGATMAMGTGGYMLPPGYKLDYLA